MSYFLNGKIESILVRMKEKNENSLNEALFEVLEIASPPDRIITELCLMVQRADIYMDWRLLDWGIRSQLVRVLHILIERRRRFIDRENSICGVKLEHVWGDLSCCASMYHDKSRLPVFARHFKSALNLCRFFTGSQ